MVVDLDVVKENRNDLQRAVHNIIYSENGGFTEKFDSFVMMNLILTLMRTGTLALKCGCLIRETSLYTWETQQTITLSAATVS